MSLLAEYRAARRAEDTARLRRSLALRAMAASGATQRDMAAELGISQPAVSQQLRSGPRPGDVHPEALLDAGGPILRQLAEQRGFTELAVFGSVARGEARCDSDVDLVVRQPPGTTISGLRALQQLFAAVLDRPVDLITYGGLKPGLDDDILREAVLL